jgi:hypothetical protein
MLSFSGLLFASFVVAACGGATPAPHSESNATAAEAPPPAGASASAAPVVQVPPITTPEQAARVFVAAIAQHDVTAVARVANDDFGRGQVRAHADVTSAELLGPATADAWPGLGDGASLFWATFTTNARVERVLLAVDPATNRVVGLRDQAMRDRIAAEQRALAAKPIDAQGKLLSKPVAGIVRVEVQGGVPAVGAKARLSRRIDPSIPFLGGSWVVIADTEVTAVAGTTVTLKIVAQKSEMKINGKPLDHYTVGVPISLEWTPTQP